MATVWFGVLGSVVVLRAGEVVTPRSVTTRTILATLLLAEGRPLTADRLLTLLRPDEMPQTGRAWVHVAMSRVRSWLSGTLGAEAALDHRTGGYHLVVPPDSTDVARFGALCAVARDRPCEERAELLDQALDLWRGPVFEDCPATLRDGELAADYERRRLLAAYEFAEATLVNGKPERAVSRLTDLTGAHPLDERLHGLLALALSGTGRQADALGLIERTKLRLAEELGVDPGEHLRSAHLKVLRQQGLPRPGSDTDRWAGPRPHLRSLIGRDADRGGLVDLLTGNRLVTLVGPGGCGKTTLALHVAEVLADRFPDGVVVAGLAAAKTGEDVVMQLGGLVGATGPSTEQVRQLLVRTFADRHALVVLDNCEHVADAVASIAHELMAAGRELVLLTTSRQPLGMVQEVVSQLKPLDAAAAGELFERRATDALPTFISDGQLVGRVCHRLDGLPLAIELAAALVRALPLQELAKRLERSLTLLDSSVRAGAQLTGTGRCRSLQATVAWSYDLLDDAQRLLLARLAVFRGDFCLTGAEAVGTCDTLPVDDVLPLLVSLIDRSLVIASGTGRYRLLEGVREFAWRVLADSDATDEVTGALLRHWLGRARELDAVPLLRDRVPLAREWFADVANLALALDYAFAVDPAAGAELAARMNAFWLANPAYLGEGTRRLHQAEEVASVCPADVRALVRHHIARLTGLRGDYATAMELATGNLDELGRTRPREYREAIISAVTEARFLLDPAAVTRIEPVLAAIGDDDHSDEPSTALTAAAGALAVWGRYDEAAELCRRYAARAARRGTRFSIAHEVVRAEIALGRGDLAEAERWSQTLLERLPSAGSPLESEPVLRVTATIHLVQGRDHEAVSFLTDAVADLRGRYPSGFARDVHLQVLLAEAERRTGDQVGATTRLWHGLARMSTLTHFRVNFIAVLVGALLAGDTRLGRRWDTLRRRLGLPVPVAFAAATAELLGEIPTPGAGHGEWDRAELVDLTETLMRHSLFQP